MTWFIVNHWVSLASIKEVNMQFRHTLTLAATVAALLTGTGCAVSRGQESVGAYVDDATIRFGTTRIT